MAVLAAWPVAGLATTASDTFDLNATVMDPVLPDAGAVPLFLSVTVNDEPTGLVAEFHATLDGADMKASRAELEEVGIKAPRHLGPNVRLSDIEGLSYDYSIEDQAIYISTRNENLYPEVISAARLPQHQEPDESYGAVLNYSVTADAVLGGTTGTTGINALAASLEGWVFMPYGTFGSTGFIRKNVANPGNDKFLRQETALNFYSPDQAQTFTLGDFTSSGPGWARPIRMGGIQIRRDFSLRSDIVTDQRLSYSGAAAMPSSVDVFIENNRIFSGQLDSGPFRLEDLPVHTGAGDAEIVIRGLDGTIRRETVSFFNATQLLKKGTVDYSVEMGFAREAYNLKSNEYGAKPVFSGSLRYGVTDKLTAELHAAATPDLRLFGGGVTAVPLNFAEVSFSAATSDYNGNRGFFYQTGVSTEFGGIGIDMTSTRTEADFADLAYVTGLEYLGAANIAATGSLLEVPLEQDVFSISIPITERKVGVSLVRSKRRNSSDYLASASFGTSVMDGRGAISFNGAHNLKTDESRLSVGFSLNLGKRKHVRSSTYTNTNGEMTADVTYARSRGDSVGDYGYQAQLGRQNDTTALRLQGDYRGRYAEVTGEVDTAATSTYMRAQVEGAAVWSGGRMAFGTPIDDSFALVDVGVGDVPVYLQNRHVGHTDRSGRALVTGLQSYRDNRVSVNVRDLPDDATLGVTAMNVVPGRKSGQMLDFDGQSGGGVLVVLRRPGGAYLSPGSVVYLNGSRDEFYVGYDGQTWLENAGAQNTLRVSTPAGDCTARFAYRATGAVQDIIDPVECR